MDRVELHDVEYGDCTVLVGQNRQILMAVSYTHLTLPTILLV